jgi:hypothetical protein
VFSLDKETLNNNKITVAGRGISEVPNYCHSEYVHTATYLLRKRNERTNRTTELFTETDRSVRYTRKYIKIINKIAYIIQRILSFLTKVG